MEKLTLNSSTFLWTKGSRALLYDSASGSKYNFVMSDELTHLCAGLSKYENLYAVMVDKKPKDVSAFISNIVENGFGVLENDEQSNMVSLPPLLNIQRDYERLKSDTSRSVGDSLTTYLSTLEIQLGGEYVGADYHNQIVYPHSTTEYLNVEAFEFISQTLQSEYLTAIRIVSPNLVTYPYVKELLQILQPVKQKVAMYCLLNEIDDFARYLQLLSDGFKVVFIADIGAMLNKIPSVIRDKFSYVITVNSEQDYELYESMYSNNQSFSHSCAPVFDNNEQFFKDNVFMTEEDMTSTKLNKRQVYVHQAINTNFFGTLNIDSDSKIYSCYSSPSLGSVGNTLYDMLVAEMEHNYAWRRVRADKPCADCIYQWLCPSPSNYERVIGRPNLCNIK